METRSRREVFEEKLERYKKIKAKIEGYKTSNKSFAAKLEGMFMIDEMADIREFLGERISETKLFTIGENNMSRAELQSELRHLTGFISRDSLQDEPEFGEEVYEMLEEECVDIYGTFDFERQLDEERWKNFDLDYSKSRIDMEKIEYANMRRQSRKQEEKNRKAFEKQQGMYKDPEVSDSSDKSKLRKRETGRSEFGRG